MKGTKDELSLTIQEKQNASRQVDKLRVETEKVSGRLRDTEKEVDELKIKQDSLAK